MILKKDSGVLSKHNDTIQFVIDAKVDSNHHVICQNGS